MGELRVRKIQEFIKQEVSKMLLNELKDPRNRFRHRYRCPHHRRFARRDDLRQPLWRRRSEKTDLRALKRATGYIRTEVANAWHPLFAVHCI